jgi:hypothetical protein
MRKLGRCKEIARRLKSRGGKMHGGRQKEGKANRETEAGDRLVGKRFAKSCGRSDSGRMAAIKRWLGAFKGFFASY